MSLDLTLVEAYLAVIDGGGFRAAAQRLGRAQPTISQQVRRLEARLGTALVLRSHRHCRATPEGARFAPLARRALDAANHAVAALKGDHLVVGAASNPGLYLLPPLLDAAIELRLGTNPETLSRLEAGAVDVAVTEWWDERPGYDAVVWHVEPLVGIVPMRHRWTDRDSMPLASFLSEPLIGGEPGTGTGRLLAETLGRDAEPARVVRQMGSTDGVKRAVSAGLGVSVVLACTVCDEVAAGSLHVLTFPDAKLRRRLFAIIGSDAPPTAPGRRFIAQLLAAGCVASIKPS